MPLGADKAYRNRLVPKLTNAAPAHGHGVMLFPIGGAKQHPIRADAIDKGIRLSGRKCFKLLHRILLFVFFSVYADLTASHSKSFFERSTQNRFVTLANKSRKSNAQDAARFKSGKVPRIEQRRTFSHQRNPNFSSIASVCA
jgi:hypothetical protein